MKRMWDIEKKLIKKKRWMSHVRIWLNTVDSVKGERRPVLLVADLAYLNPDLVGFRISLSPRRDKNYIWASLCLA